MKDIESTGHEAAFITDHLALATYLATRGHEPQLIPSGSGQVLFQFEVSNELSAGIAAFNSSTGSVEPRAYDATRIRLRRAMDAVLGGGR